MTKGVAYNGRFQLEFGAGPKMYALCSKLLLMAKRLIDPTGYGFIYLKRYFKKGLLLHNNLIS